jgi:predicted component of type VI protein secretion system
MPHDGGESRDVYRMLDERDWLDAAEAQALADLLRAFWSVRQLPRRLERALWASEHVAWERYLDVILPALVAALEGLLNTSRKQLMRQFTTCVSALAAELGVPDVSKNLCRKLYEGRSQGAHGDDIDLFKPEARRPARVEQLARLREVLRAVVRRGIEDPAFRSALESEETVRARWPVEVRGRLRRCRRTAL